MPRSIPIDDLRPGTEYAINLPTEDGARLWLFGEFIEMGLYERELVVAFQIEGLGAWFEVKGAEFQLVEENEDCGR